MSFLVLGFKDILAFLRVPTPKNSLEASINLHVQEDSDHWLWYLADLERLGFTRESWGRALPTC